VSKEGEKNYFSNIGEEGIRHAMAMPFLDANCGGYLAEIGAVLSLLPPPPATLLDLGCGAGWTSRFFARRGYDVTGADLSQVAIDHAVRLNDEEQRANLRYVVRDYENRTFDAQFDCAVFFASLHHATDETAAVRAAYQALKPAGVCVVSEPGRGHAAATQSREAVAKYGVNENDMPPARIIRAGKRAGFRAFRVYPHAEILNHALYGGRASGGLRGTLAAVAWVLFYKRYNGIVLMIK